MTYSVADWRKRMGLTQVQASALLGVAVRTIAGIEGDERPPSRTIIAACRWFEQERSPAPQPAPEPFAPALVERHDDALVARVVALEELAARQAHDIRTLDDAVRWLAQQLGLPVERP